MLRKSAFLIVLLLFILLSAWAGGKKDNLSHDVENPEGFSEVIDTSEKKPGKYNFYLEATDKGENVTLSGPHNIFIDPESDLPVITIANPRDNMHVQGNLNIVGTCVDDDAVEYVEIWFNDDEENTKVRAEGSEFWSYYYDTTMLLDGLYSISIRGVDINGIPGRVKRVEWHMDRKKPETRITSHHLGALVNNKISLKGSVFDGNSVKSLSYSIDGGNKYINVPLKSDKRYPTQSNFEFTLNTRVLNDGPVVVWFKAYDKMGTLGVASHLLFVDNKNPDVQLVYPEAGVKVNGLFSISGYAKDTVGLASLTWKLGKETGEFPLTIGNPYWTKDFDIRGMKTSGLDLEIRAVDLSGNVSVVKRKLQVDQNADLPVVTINEPPAGAIISNNSLNLKGTIGDDDGPASLFYSLGGSAPAELPCTGYFQLTIKDIPAGTHNLEVWAKDKTGLLGPKVLIKGIVNPGIEPQPEFFQVRTGSGKNIETREFHTGMEINSESGSTLDLRVRSGSALQSIIFQLGTGTPVTIVTKASRGGEFIQGIPIPVDMDFGQVRLSVKVSDVYGRETSLEEYIYVTDLTAPRIIDDHVSYNKLSDGTITLKGLGEENSWPDTIVHPRGTKTTIPLRAAIDPALQVSKAVVEVAGRTITAKVAKDGTITAVLPADLPAELLQLSLKATLKTTKEKPDVITHEARGEFWLLRPRVSGQVINVSEGFIWVRPDMGMGDQQILLPTTREALIGLYNGRPLKDVSISGANSDSMTVGIDQYGRVALVSPDVGSHGPLNLTLTDKDGKEFATDEFTFFQAADAPSFEFINSPENIWVQNEVPMRFTAGSDLSISAVESSIDLGATWQPLVDSGDIARLGSGVDAVINVESLPDGAVNLRIRVSDEAKGQSVISFFVNKDTHAPQARLIVPISEDRVNGTIVMGMTIEEMGQLVSVVYDKPETETEGGKTPAISKTLYTYDPSDANALPLTFLEVVMDSIEMPLSEDMTFTFTDLSGNVFVLDTWPFMIDNEMDVPVLEISLPIENEVITTDFVISGIAYDDDAVKQIYWFIDENPEAELEVSHGYSIPVSLLSLTDNEHSITIVVEDIYGVKSQPVIRNFRVSLEEPKARLESPSYDIIVRENVILSGISSDRNDIEKVQISLDNGNTFNDATGTTVWSYEFNSKILQDGTHVVFIKVFDKYGISALYSSLINIDNTAPEVVLDSPLDGMVTTGTVNITGRTIDNILMEAVVIELRSLDDHAVTPGLARRSVQPASILMEVMDISDLEDGLYNIEVWAIDKANNITRVSRNIQLAMHSNPNFIDIMYPLNGEYVQGSFNLYGMAGGVDHVSSVTIVINGEEIEAADVTETGFYRFSLNEEYLVSGPNQIEIRSDFDGKGLVKSSERTLHYAPTGAWITIDTLAMGDFAYERPWLSGRAGYTLSDGDIEILADKNADKELKDAVKAKKLESIDLSFDNGKTFVKAGRGREKGQTWSYRLETGEMAEGIHYLIVRANMANGEVAISRTLIQVDKTPPVIRLIAPENGGIYNTSIEFSALASDDIALKGLSYHLRSGDKAAYEVPGFIQGLYFEASIPPFLWQAVPGSTPGFLVAPTYMDIGVGLSFFDDNVKVQAQYGFMTQDIYESLGGTDPLRYGGHVLGVKLLANLYTLPFAAFLGPDWEWLSASFGVGANFSYFDLGKEGYTQSGSPTWLSALLLQIEFPKVTIPKRTSLRTFSFFTEGQLWFVPTDVDAEANKINVVEPKIIFGLRLYIF